MLQLGDIVDARDPELGSWFEAKIQKITRNKEKPKDEGESEGSVLAGWVAEAGREIRIG